MEPTDIVFLTSSIQQLVDSIPSKDWDSGTELIENKVENIDGWGTIELLYTIVAKYILLNQQVRHIEPPVQMFLIKDILEKYFVNNSKALPKL
jgi:hypothetical protein